MHNHSLFWRGPLRFLGMSDDAPSTPDLRLRTTPTQARSQESFDKILDATAALLDELGLDGMSTNLVAERAGVRVRTVYRYFPNKHALVAALFRRQTRQANRILLFGVGKLADPNKDWQEALRALVRDYFEAMLDSPGWLTVRRTVMASPALAQLAREAVVEPTQALEEVLARRGVSVRRERLAIITELVQQMSTAGVDLAIRHRRARRQAIIEELGNALVRYLAPVVDG